MLVIISDLHLSDGSTGGTISPGAFSIFAERLKQLAVSASWRADGTYRPIERIDLILLGDVLDPIRSTRWTSRSNVRPWGNPHSPEFLDQIVRITSDILEHNAEGLAVLRGLAAEGGLTVPAALRSSRPADLSSAVTGGEGQPVQVRIHYMVGNHDWFYHLPGPNYDALRRMLVQRMGLANRPDRPLPHEITESEELLQAMRRHKVAARHGDIFDPFNYEGDRDASSLGDVIVIELANRFASEVEAGLGSELPVSTVLGLREIDNIRPLMLIPVWIDGLLERTCTLPAMRKRVKTVWDRLADEFLQIDFVRQRDTWSPFDLVDGLERALKFSKRLSIGWTSSIVEWLHKIRGSSSDSFYQYALTEQDFRNRRAKHIVYGHTHTAESVPLDASYAEGFVLDQTYFNAGTWRRVHRQTQLAPSEHEFVACDVMTYLAFFQGDERKGRPYETWSGTLGHPSTEITVHRIDPGPALERRSASHVTGTTVSASSLQDHAPHFPASSVEPGIAPSRRV
jgi:UDP-2,3-diacylglucosamine pyrophosphatase LpxH